MFFAVLVYFDTLFPCSLADAAKKNGLNSFCFDIRTIVGPKVEFLPGNSDFYTSCIKLPPGQAGVILCSNRLRNTHRTFTNSAKLREKSLADMFSCFSPMLRTLYSILDYNTMIL